jgi:hypothetical protein
MWWVASSLRPGWTHPDSAKRSTRRDGAADSSLEPERFAQRATRCAQFREVTRCPFRVKGAAAHARCCSCGHPAADRRTRVRRNPAPSSAAAANRPRRAELVAGAGVVLDVHAAIRSADAAYSSWRRRHERIVAAGTPVRLDASAHLVGLVASIHYKVTPSAARRRSDALARRGRRGLRAFPRRTPARS